MPVTYTNRKGVTYHLYLGVTKTGKPRYYFTREPRDEPVVEIPEGYAIIESVNGVVSLIKERPMPFLPEEIVAVEAAIQMHPKGGDYRVSIKHDRIEVYERVGPDPDELIAELGIPLHPGQVALLRERQDRRAQFTPVLRFILVDAERRIFGIQRMCYLGNIDDWIHVGEMGSMDVLTQRLIPKLGTDQFFELH